MLNWNQYEFIECLGIMPEVDEYETYSFQVSKHGLRMELSVVEYSGDVYISLYREGLEGTIFNLWLKNCPAARYIAYKNGAEYLEFSPSESFGKSIDGESPAPFSVHVAVNPHISIEVF